jgi:HlyD family secretion protein
MNNAWPLVLVLAVATGLACSTGCRPDATDAANDAARNGTVRVETLTATRTTMQRTTTQPATVHADYEARVFAKAAGYLTQLKVDIGTSVRKGDVLAVMSVPEMAKQREAKLATIRRMEADERRAASQLAVAKARVASYQAKRDKAKAEVGKAEAGLTAARVELNRATDLVQQQAVADRLQHEAQKKYAAAAAEKAAAKAAVRSAEAELLLTGAQSNAAQAGLDVAKATTDVARRELDELDELIKYAQLTAPFDGVVTQRTVDPGDLVRNTQTGSSQGGPPLFVITKLDKVRIRVPVPERDTSLATIGDAAKITLQALPGEVFEGEIARLAGVLEPLTRTMLVEIDLPNPDGRLRPGMFGQATITLAPPGDTWTLPANAIHYDEQGNSYVYVVNASNQVTIAEVQTGLDNGEQIEITAGLNGNERIVGPLLRRLKAGQKVKG